MLAPKRKNLGRWKVSSTVIICSTYVSTTFNNDLLGQQSEINTGSCFSVSQRNQKQHLIPTTTLRAAAAPILQPSQVPPHAPHTWPFGSCCQCPVRWTSSDREPWEKTSKKGRQWSRIPPKYCWLGSSSELQRGVGLEMIKNSLKTMEIRPSRI